MKINEKSESYSITKGTEKSLDAIVEVRISVPENARSRAKPIRICSY
jgi:hypothetical protein